MGIYYTAGAIVGVKVDIDRTPVIQRVRRCAHPEVHGAKFCPECGRLTWDEERHYPDVSEITEWLNEGVRKPWVFEIGYDSNWFVIGVGNLLHQHGGDEIARIDLPDRSDLLTSLEALLAPRLLWSDEVAQSFGVYTTYVGR